MYRACEEVHPSMRKIQPPLPVAVLALVLSTTGGAYAAAKITSAQIKDATITSKDIHDHTIGGRDIADATISVDNLTDGALRQLEGPRDRKVQLDRQAWHPPRASAVPSSPRGPSTSGAAAVASSTATCPAGTYVTGGGYVAGSIEDLVEYALSSPTQYSVIAVNDFSQPNSIQAQAICAGGGGGVASSVRAHANTGEGAEACEGVAGRDREAGLARGLRRRSRADG